MPTAPLAQKLPSTGLIHSALPVLENLYVCSDKSSLNTPKTPESFGCWFPDGWAVELEFTPLCQGHCAQEIHPQVRTEQGREPELIPPLPRAGSLLPQLPLPKISIACPTATTAGHRSAQSCTEGPQPGSCLPASSPRLGEVVSPHTDPLDPPHPLSAPCAASVPSLTLVGHAHAQESPTTSCHAIPPWPGLWCSLDSVIHCTNPARGPQGWRFQCWSPAPDSSSGTAGSLSCTRQTHTAARGD